MKTIEKKHKKIIGPAGSRTSTRQRLARGLGPDSVWPEDLDPNAGVVHQGNTTGKHNGETKWKNEKKGRNRKITSINFKSI